MNVNEAVILEDKMIKILLKYDDIADLKERLASVPEEENETVDFVNRCIDVIEKKREFYKKTHQSVEGMMLLFPVSCNKAVFYYMESDGRPFNGAPSRIKEQVLSKWR